LGSGKTDYVGATKLAKELAEKLATPAEPVREEVADHEVA
jgi:acyl-[acyl-carrier-protein]-phospholipid O-acyltransferase/long-chain-fatty-acid--[acyl-carrier-protein] ligase